MDEAQDQTTQLIERLSALSEKDREAVLGRMSADERIGAENALDQFIEAERLEEERQKRIDRQFLGYSPWLASLVEKSQNSAPIGMSQTCSNALWEIHSAKVGSGMNIPRTGWRGMVERVNKWLATNGGQRA
ncbi:hypothetical protein [uncultured Erythrobacter sp.]|uniref:hypothetical protein n=1 Tax=uncultured Erythrobacter sp. TaxID=263913 RepID=UPI0026129167|nr:hypothetical protein [uncultured Erythrobacter sp.]